MEDLTAIFSKWQVYLCVVVTSTKLYSLTACTILITGGSARGKKVKPKTWWICPACHVFGFTCLPNLVPRAMPVRGLRLALALGKRNEIRNFIGCREINNLGAA